MGYDPFSPITLAQVNLLCVPAGLYTPQRFEEHSRALRAFRNVSLKNGSDESKFSAYKNGWVLLNISNTVFEDGSDISTWLDFNSKPQIVIGLIDGVTLHGHRDDDLEQMLSTTLDSLRQSTSLLNESAICLIVILGGSQVLTYEDCCFVDLEGDGPSLPDIIREIVIRFQIQVEDRVKALETDAIASVTDGSGRSSPLTGPNERNAEQVKNPPRRINSPAIGPGMNGLPGDERNEATTKHTVLRGQLNLQAGQWPEALRYFSEGATVARNSMMHLWYGKALEGLYVCMLLFAWAGLDFNVPQICYPPSDKRAPVYNSPSLSAICAANRSLTESLSSGRSISSVHTLTLLTPYLLSTIINQYERVAGIHQDAIHFRILCQARVRWGALLLNLKKHGSVLNATTLQSLVEHYDNGSTINHSDTSMTALILHVKALAKIFIDASLDGQSRLPVRQAMPILIAVASKLSHLGVERKQGFYLRELLRQLGPGLTEARRIGAAEIGVHPSANFSSLYASSKASIGMARVDLRVLLESVCEIYGLPKSFNDHAEPEDSVSRLRSALHLWSTAHSAGDVMMKTDILNLCVEVSDAIPDLDCSLFFMVRLLQVSIGRPTLLEGVDGPVPMIPSNEQSQIIRNIRKNVSTAAQSETSNTRAIYWDKCLVRLIKLSEEPGSNTLMPRTARDLSLAAGANNEVKKDPFIFNPFAKTRGKTGQSIIVVGEQARFEVILQNPLSVEVEIEDITLMVEGCNFQPNHHSIMLGPLCSQVFVLSGTAQLPGDLVVTGCRAAIRDCHAEDFLIVQGDWKPSQTAKLAAKSTPISSADEIVLPKIEQLSVKVIAPLPKLSITSTSLLQQSLMLLEGEMTRFTMILKNESDLDVDLALVTFEDSVTRRLEEALNNKDLLPADLYEIQNQIATRPVVRVVDTQKVVDSMDIPARKHTELDFEVFGRPGLTDITVLIDYTFLGIPKENLEGSFYTRQLRHNIATTVNGSVDVARCSLLPIEGNVLPAFQGTVEQEALTSAIKLEQRQGDRCMLLLDVRNIWPQPLDVQLQACQPELKQDHETDQWEKAFTVTETLQPGQMTRILLLAPRILVDDPYAPIPSLDTKRQFVVSASKMTIEAEATSRELFWYRERLLKCLRATWKEQNGSRSGQIDMRKGIRLNPRIIDALKMDLVEVSFSLQPTMSSPGSEDQGQNTIKQTGTSQFSLSRNTFANLVTTIHNQSKEELRLLLRLQPSLRNQPHNIALDLSKRFAWTGVLQKALHPALQPNETREVELGIIALAEGDYEVHGTVEEIKSRTAQAEPTTLGIGNGIERRLWHARRPCLIDVIDRVPPE